ncbi:tetratricopeptide repeat protein [Candidatus Poribacteria bacterium]|nr:tetratricopeptide repeat protein [Candidatus Poribacteria bacterium]
MNTITEAHYNRGIAYLETKQYNRAVREFEAAIKLDADFIGVHCALCRAYLEQNELEKASTSVIAALTLDATHQPALLLCDTITQAYYDNGKEYLNAERYTEAVSTFQKALTLNADLERSSQVTDIENKHIYAHLGAAYIRLKSYPAAIDALQNAIALDAELVDAHYYLGYAYVEQGYYKKAIPHLEQVIAIAPHLKRAHYNLARAYRELGNWEAATHAVTETLKLDPNYQPAKELADILK